MRIRFQNNFHSLGRSIKAFTWMFILVLSVCQKLFAQPVISEQPSDNLVCSGSNVTFKVEASGIDPLTFQWQADDGGGFLDIGGETGNILLLSGADVSMDSYHYRCIVTDDNGDPTISNSALLNVVDDPVANDLTKSPADATVCAGSHPDSHGKRSQRGHRYDHR